MVRCCVRVVGTYWKQRAGTHPCFWHAAPADAQSLDIEREGTHTATFACHGRTAVNLQHTLQST